MTSFSQLKLEGWRQFSKVEIDFDRQITILTGQNGCGKTTLLNILNRHFGWNLNFVSTPYIGKKKANRLWSDIFNPHKKNVNQELENENNVTNEIGSITYVDGKTCGIFTNLIVSSQYQLDYRDMQNVVGMHIPSHRPVATYNSIQNIPTDAKNATQEYQQFQQLLAQFYGGQRSENPGKIQKQSLISFAVFGEGNSAVTPNPDIRSMFEGFQDVLRKVMPTSLGFQRIEIRMPEVVLVTDTGDFSLDAMSGGINAIFSIAWQIYMFGYDKDNFVITIDEPENHLHPIMQRSLLPNLAAAFPRAKIIAATHSPFVVSSFPDANIYALFKNEDGVISKRLEEIDISGTPNEVLRDILDVDSNLPIWVEKIISDVIADVSTLPDAEKARNIMSKLKQLGIADAILEYRS